MKNEADRVGWLATAIGEGPHSPRAKSALGRFIGFLVWWRTWATGVIIIVGASTARYWYGASEAVLGGFWLGLATLAAVEVLVNRD